MYHVFFSHVSRIFFSCITYFFLMYHVFFSHLSPRKPLIILVFWHPQSIYKVSYKVSMKVSPLEKSLHFFNFSKKKDPFGSSSFKTYLGSLQLKAEGSPTPDTKLCPLRYPFPVTQQQMSVTPPTVSLRCL